MRRSLLPAALLALTLSACSTSPRPDVALAAGSASLDAARSAGAGELSPQMLQQAQAKLARARQLAQAGQSAEAIRLAEQAQADAGLARAQAASERARRAAEEVQASLRSLREELQRAGNRPLSVPEAPPAPGTPSAPGAPSTPSAPRTTP